MQKIRLWSSYLSLKTNLWLAGIFSSIGYYFLSRSMQGLQREAEVIAEDIDKLIHESNSKLH